MRPALARGRPALVGAAREPPSRARRDAPLRPGGREAAAAEADTAVRPTGPGPCPAPISTSQHTAEQLPRWGSSLRLDWYPCVETET